jgi:hypothetical protein
MIRAAGIKAELSGSQCPLWVKSGHGDNAAGCPLYPQKRTLMERAEMSALGHKLP